MGSSLKFAFSSLIAAPFISMAGIPPAYETPEKANEALSKACPLQTGMKAADQHIECVNETLSQTQTFANDFHTHLYTHIGIAPDINNKQGHLLQDYQNMLDGWDKRIKQKKTELIPDEEKDQLDYDSANIRFYARQCHDGLNEIKGTALQSLNFSHTTAYSGAKNCLETAKRISSRWGIDFDQKGYDRLMKHMDLVYNFYTANPTIPAQKPAAPGRTSEEWQYPEPKKDKNLRDLRWDIVESGPALRA